MVILDTQAVRNCDRKQEAVSWLEFDVVMLIFFPAPTNLLSCIKMLGSFGSNPLNDIIWMI